MKSYYEIDSSDPPSLEEIVRRWAEESKQAVDASNFHLYLPVDQLLQFREHDRAKHEFRNLDDQEWSQLKHSLQDGWDEEKPALLMIGQDGCVYLGEGNHRVSIADQLGLEYAPVRLIFLEHTDACKGDRGTQVYRKDHTTAKEDDGLSGDSAPLQEAVSDMKESSHGSFKVDNQMFATPAQHRASSPMTLEGEDENLELGGHKINRHHKNNQVRRAFRPTDTIIIGGLFESDEAELKDSTHLYNNLFLTFDDIADILDKASEGKLKGYERADGYSFFFTLDGNEIKLARTQSEMKMGGYTISQLRNKRWEGEEIMKCCRQGLRELEKGMYNIKNSLKNRIFQGGDIFYRATLVSDEIEGIVDYNSSFINIDKIGCYEVKDNKVERVNTRETKKYSQYLDNLLEKIENQEGKSKFSKQRTAVQTLNALDNTGPLRKAVQKLSEQLSRYDLSGSDTIKDYLHARIRHLLASNHPQLNETEVDAIFQIITRQSRFDNVEEDIRDDNEELAKEFDQSTDRRQRTLRIAIWPIQKIIQRFTAKLLKGLESAYVLKDGTSDEVREKIQTAIENIREYGLNGAEKAEKELIKQLEAIKDLDNLEIPLREFVFSYDGKLFKFSGNYDPVRTILTLYNKGMNSKDIPSIKQQIEEASEASMRSSQTSHPMTNKRVAVIPGDFKPPHAGHYELVNHMVNMKEADGAHVVDEAVVLVSPRKRVGHSPDNRIVVTPKMAVALWETFTGNEERIKIQVSEYKSPLRSAFAFMDSVLDEGDVMWIAQGEKEENSEVLEKLQDYSDARQLGVDVEVEETELYHKGVSSTQMRHYLAEGNREAFTGFMPDHLTKQQREQCYELIRDMQPKETFLHERKIPVLETVDAELLSESGGVSSHWPVFGPMRNEPRKSVEREPRTPHEIPKERGNYEFGNSRAGRDSDEESVRQWKEADNEEPPSVNRKARMVKSLKRKLKKLQQKASQTDDREKISNINKEIEQTQKQFEQAKEKLVEYFVENFSELNIDEISAAAGGAVAGAPNPGMSANVQNKAAVKRYKSG